MWEIGNPIYLAGIAGIIIPIIIHLYNKHKKKVKIMGNLKWLRDIKPAQWRFRHINQWPLLILRLMIVILALLLLIDLQRNEIIKPSNLILIHPDAGDTTQYRHLAIEWQNDSVAIHWLQPGLPDIHEPAVHNNYNNIWSLIAEADFRFQPAHIQVISPNRMDLYEGNFPKLNASISWEFSEFNKDTMKLVGVNNLPDAYEFYWYHSEPQQSEFVRQSGIEVLNFKNNSMILDQDKKLVSVKNPSFMYNVPVRTIDTLFISGIVQEENKEEWKLMQQLILSLSEVHNFPVSLTENSEEAEWIFVFDEDNLGVQRSENTELIFSYKPMQSQQWLEQEGQDNFIIRRDLTTGNILEGGLFEELRPYFLKHKFKNLELPESDYRSFEPEDVPSKAYKYEVKNATIKKPDSRVRIWLISLLLALIIMERIWPKRKI